MEREFEQRVPGNRRSAVQRRVGRAGLLQQHGVLLRPGRNAEVLRDFEWNAGHHTGADRSVIHLPWNSAQRVRQRHFERHCVGN